MRHWPALVATLVLFALFGFGFAANAGAGTGLSYAPIFVPTNDTIWYSTKDGSTVWTVRYVKQPNQTEFELCGLFDGDGDVLVSYPEAGDGFEFHYDQPTPMCVRTTVGIGGGAMPLPLNVHLSQRGLRRASLTWPNVFVGTQH